LIELSNRKISTNNEKNSIENEWWKENNEFNFVFERGFIF
jgi:hypothetical protein